MYKRQLRQGWQLSITANAKHILRSPDLLMDSRDGDSNSKLVQFSALKPNLFGCCRKSLGGQRP